MQLGPRTQPLHDLLTSEAPLASEATQALPQKDPHPACSPPPPRFMSRRFYPHRGLAGHLPRPTAQEDGL